MVRVIDFVEMTERLPKREEIGVISAFSAWIIVARDFARRCFGRGKFIKLPRGYIDADELILISTMQILVDFVEIECAFMDIDEGETVGEKLYFKLPFWLRSDNLIRSRVRGLKHLSDLEAAYTAESMNIQEITDLIDVYLWWKDIRPLRRDPLEEAGWYTLRSAALEHSKSEVLDMDILPKELQERLHNAAELANTFEEAYQAEDTAMLNKLIAARSFMWT